MPAHSVLGIRWLPSSRADRSIPPTFRGAPELGHGDRQTPATDDGRPVTRVVMGVAVHDGSSGESGWPAIVSWRPKLGRAFGAAVVCVGRGCARNGVHGHTRLGLQGAVFEYIEGLVQHPLAALDARLPQSRSTRSCPPHRRPSGGVINTPTFPSNGICSFSEVPLPVGWYSTGQSWGGYQSCAPPSLTTGRR